MINSGQTEPTGVVSQSSIYQTEKCRESRTGLLPPPACPPGRPSAEHHLRWVVQRDAPSIDLEPIPANESAIPT